MRCRFGGGFGCRHMDQGQPMSLVCETAVCLAMLITGIVESTTQPAIEDMPLSLTSYWFYDENNEPVAWGGQANGDPTGYANTYPTSPTHAGKVGACIGAWVKLYNTTAVSFTWQGQAMTIHCYDAFGSVSYREPFYHAGYESWVIGVDVLSPLPYHGLVFDWSTNDVWVGDLD